MILAGIGSTDAARDRLDKAEVPTFAEGTITGVAAILLNEGRWRHRDVISILGAAAKPDGPDAHATAVVLAALARLVPELKLDVEPLDFQVPEVEGRVKKARRQAKPAMRKETSVPTRLARDPVCGLLIVPEAAAARVDVEGRAYHLCSPACAEKFRKDPRGYTDHPEFA